MVEDTKKFFGAGNLKQNSFLEHHQLSLVWFMAEKKTTKSYKIEKKIPANLMDSFFFYLLFCWPWYFLDHGGEQRNLLIHHAPLTY